MVRRCAGPRRFRRSACPARRCRRFAPMRPTPSGYVPGAPIISTADLHEGLTRLQAGQTDFDVGGAQVAFSGIPEGLHNVLRDLQESPLGAKANQLESMTIEMVAMLFDFIFETRDLPDGIKALLARLQIPVLKAAMLDGAFFAKKSHPSRLLVNELARAGLGWSPAMGQEDPLYRKIDGDRPSDPRQVLRQPRDLRRAARGARGVPRRGRKGGGREHPVDGRGDQPEGPAADRLGAGQGRDRAAHRGLPGPQLPRRRSSASNGRRRSSTSISTRARKARPGLGVTTLEDLVWSVQPKRSPEDRRHLVALLPSLLKRLVGGHAQPRLGGRRARVVHGQPRRGARGSGQAVGVAAARRPRPSRKRPGRRPKSRRLPATGAAAKAEALAEAMAQAEPEPVGARARGHRRRLSRDRAQPRARHVDRVRGDDGQLAFAKLAWVSPLRGTYLFTNRQGQKALSMTAEELAERFRADRARVVEAEPLIDRAFTQHDHADREKIPEPATSISRRHELAARRLFCFPRAPAGPDSYAQIGRRMGIGALIIGDEILSGKRQDKTSRARDRDPRARAGSALDFANYLGDDRGRLTSVLRESFARDELVFCFGGIGATPDDHTRQAAAAALGVPLARHPEAVAELEAKFGAEAYPNRVLMAEFPARKPRSSRIPSTGSPHSRSGSITSSPASRRWRGPCSTGCSRRGTPTLRARSRRARDRRVRRGREPAPAAHERQRRPVPALKLFSLPSILADGGRRIELGVRGDPAHVGAAIGHLRDGVRALGFASKRSSEGPRWF